MKTIEENIKEIDGQIGELLQKYEGISENTKRTELMEEIKDLTDTRATLKASKVEGSNSALWVSGALSIATILIIMKYEETNVITSKAYSIATRLFRG